jgi:D-alanine transaminase
MARPALVHLNGRLVPEHEARVSAWDRGFLFGDGVYEYVRYFAGVGVALDLHEARLARSLALTGIAGFDPASLGRIARELLEANGLRDAGVYLQVTRGAGTTRSHVPTPGLVPTAFAFAAPSAPIESFTQPESMRAIVRPDMRWHRCEIKTIALAGNVLALIEAQAAGADECILVRDGLVGEGAYTNAAIVKGGTLVTPPVDDGAAPVLHGTMRHWMLDAARDAGVPAEVRRIREEELHGAEEVLVQSSRRLVAAVTHLDGSQVGAGEPGRACRALFRAMRERVVREIRAAEG